MSQQCDPYYLAPLWPDSISMAGLQASALLTTRRYTERDFAEVVVESRRKAKANPSAQLSGDTEVEELLRAPYISSPLRRHDCCPITDGVSVLIITDKTALPETIKRPVYIRGIDHRMEAHQLGIRVLSESGSTTQALGKLNLKPVLSNLISLNYMRLLAHKP